MHLPLLCHDMAHPDPNGFYFPWLSPDISKDEAREVHRRAMEVRVPENANNWLPEDLHGGLILLGSGKLAVYRFFNGGRDNKGRPHRWVMLAAVVPSAQVKDRNWAGVLNHSVFASWAAKEVPLPAAEVDGCGVDAEPDRPLGQAPRGFQEGEGEFTLAADTPVTTAGLLMARLPPRCRTAHVRITAGSQGGSLRCLAEWMPVEVPQPTTPKATSHLGLDKRGLDARRNTSGQPPVPADAPSDERRRWRRIIGRPLDKVEQFVNNNPHHAAKLLLLLLILVVILLTTTILLCVRGRRAGYAFSFDDSGSQENATKHSWGNKKPETMQASPLSEKE